MAIDVPGKPAGFFVRLSPPLQASGAILSFIVRSPRCVVELDILGVGSALLLVLPRSPGGHLQPIPSCRPPRQKALLLNRCMGETDEPPCTCTSVGTYMSVHITATLLAFMHEHNTPPTQRQDRYSVLRAFIFFLYEYVLWSARSAALDRALRAQPLLQQVRRKSWQKCPSHCSSWCACGGRANVSLRLAVFVCCTLYILTHAACVGRERQREGQASCCASTAQILLGELGPRRLAGFSPSTPYRTGKPRSGAT